MQRNNLSKVKRVVVKVGSQALRLETCESMIQSLSQDFAHLQKEGIEVLLVSSGAIHVGREHSSFSGNEISALQSLSAIGQPQLMKSYLDHFEQHDLKCAQVLMTHEDFKNRKRYLNAKNVFENLLSWNTIPIINENDSVSFEEITLGDNDQLAGMVAQMVSADLLILLTTPDGLYDKDPELSNATKINFVPFGESIAKKLKLKGQSAAGRGGMKTKLEAVKRVTPLGIPVVISTYKESSPVCRSIYKETGTFFEASLDSSHLKGKERLFSLARSGRSISIDEGAYNALKKGASLLPTGVLKVNGPFNRGDCVTIKYQRKTIAVGLMEYSSKDLDKIKGQKVKAIIDLLGVLPSKVISHRNNLVLKEK